MGSPAADVVFSEVNDPQFGATSFVAPSPQGDLAGRPSIKIAHTNSKNGVERTLLQIKEPQFNATSETYDDHIQVNVTATRKTTAAVASVDRVLEMAEKALTQLRDELANAEL